MLATLTLAALSLVPAQTGGLTLTNKRVTYGLFGQERKEKQVIVGDLFTLTFDIEGLQVEEDGKVKYSLGMKLFDADGKLQFEQEPRDLEAVLSLGGTRTKGNALVEIATDTKPGKYTMVVVIADRLAKTKSELKQEFEVVAPRLGLIRTQLTYQASGNEPAQPAPPVAAVGQVYILNFCATGMKLDTKKQPNLSVELRVLDDTGKATLVKNPTGEVKSGVPDVFSKILPFQFALQLNRPGKYKVEFKIKDNNDGGKTAEQTLDFTVYEIK